MIFHYLPRIKTILYKENLSDAGNVTSDQIGY